MGRVPSAGIGPDKLHPGPIGQHTCALVAAAPKSLGVSQFGAARNGYLGQLGPEVTGLGVRSMREAIVTVQSMVEVLNGALFMTSPFESGWLTTFAAG
jgi:hypothetical protein